MTRVVAGMISVLGLAVLAGVGCSSKQTAPAPAPQVLEVLKTPTFPVTLDEAVASEYRTPANRKRDADRHPLETLQFFGVRPDQTVVEISPSAGWYTEVLAPYLTPQGHYVAAVVPSGENEHMQQLNATFDAWMVSHPEVRAKAAKIDFDPASPLALDPSALADTVLTFRNVHNWMGNGQAQAAFNNFYKALKPGGTLGVVEHRANPTGKLDPKSGYVREADVIRMAKKAGFRLEAKSEINANPKDTKDYPEGVWSLPPTFAMKEKDHERFAAIGESDRMTLRFVKPAK